MLYVTRPTKGVGKIHWAVAMVNHPSKTACGRPNKRDLGRRVVAATWNPELVTCLACFRVMRRLLR